MGKTKQSEVERHRKLRRNRKKELNKYRALWEFLTKKHPKTLEAFEVEYANQPSTSQGPNSNEISEEPLKAPQPTPKANPKIEDSNQLPEEPLNTPQPTFEAFSTATPQIDLSESILYDEFLTELNCIDF